MPNFEQSNAELRMNQHRTLNEVTPNLEQSFPAKFTSKWKHIFCAYRTYELQ